MTETGRQASGLLHDMDDERLLVLAGSGDKKAEESLINNYKFLVRAKARSYFLVGADTDDIMQEGMIGLFKAIRDYDRDKQTSFKTFAELCITRQIISAIKAATRQKHAPLNSYVSLSKPVYDEQSDKTLHEVINSLETADPEEIVIKREEFEAVGEMIRDILSPFEKQVLSCYLDGLAYREIAERLQKENKAIDNALQRIKRKLLRLLASRDRQEVGRN